SRVPAVLRGLTHQNRHRRNVRGSQQPLRALAVDVARPEYLGIPVERATETASRPRDGTCSRGARLQAGLERLLQVIVHASQPRSSSSTCWSLNGSCPATSRSS